MAHIDTLYIIKLKKICWFIASIVIGEIEISGRMSSIEVFYSLKDDQRTY